MIKTNWNDLPRCNDCGGKLRRTRLTFKFVCKECNKYWNEEDIIIEEKSIIQ